MTATVVKMAWAALALLATPALAETALPDPAQEARADALGREIRCVVCENEPIAQSSAEIAADMRRVVRERIAAGDTDAEVRAWFAARYGAFVLLRPPVSGATLALWAGPFVLLLAGAGAMILTARQKRLGAAVPEANGTDGPGAVEDEAARAALARAEQI